jgi:PAS domain S-box-containing protein
MLDGETRFIRQTDKKLRWARVMGRLELDAHGRPHTLRGTIEDISERRLAEGQVRESTGLLELFIQDAPTGLALFDREMRYISASRRWIEDMGVKEWDLAGKSHYELGYRIPDRWKEEHRRAMDGETVSFNEDHYQREDGSERWVRRMVRPWWTGHGTVGGIVVLSEDITATKEAECALRESEESLKEAQRIAGVGSYVLDLVSGVWSSSPMLDEILGIDASYDVLGSDAYQGDRETAQTYCAFRFADGAAEPDSARRSPATGDGTIPPAREYRYDRLP